MKRNSGVIYDVIDSDDSEDSDNVNYSPTKSKNLILLFISTNFKYYFLLIQAVTPLSTKRLPFKKEVSSESIPPTKSESASTSTRTSVGNLDNHGTFWGAFSDEEEKETFQGNLKIITFMYNISQHLLDIIFYRSIF